MLRTLITGIRASRKLKKLQRNCPHDRLYRWPAFNKAECVSCHLVTELPVTDWLDSQGNSRLVN